MGQSLWVREAAEFETEGDHVICRWQDTEWIMSPHVAQIVSARLNRALDDWRVDQSDKVETIRERG